MPRTAPPVELLGLLGDPDGPRIDQRIIWRTSDGHFGVAESDWVRRRGASDSRRAWRPNCANGRLTGAQYEAVRAAVKAADFTTLSVPPLGWWLGLASRSRYPLQPPYSAAGFGAPHIGVIHPPAPLSAFVAEHAGAWARWLFRLDEAPPLRFLATPALAQAFAAWQQALAAFRTDYYPDEAAYLASAVALHRQLRDIVRQAKSTSARQD